MTLLKLAKERFGDLTEVEEKLFLDIQMDGMAIFLDDLEDIDPSTADLPELPAECVAWLLTDRKVGELITHRGVTVVGARLTGVLDASFARFPWQVNLFHCHVSEGLNLREASLGLLRLSRSHVGWLSADGMGVSGDVFLGQGFTACGEVRFLGASIGGDLECSGATFDNAGGYALSTNRMKVSGAVFLNKGFSAEGEVCLVGSSIGGKLECTGGSFQNSGGDALNLEAVTLSGAVYCNGMAVDGRVKIENSSLHRKLHLADNIWEAGSSLSLIGTSVNVLCDGNGAWPDKGNVRLNGFTYEAIHDEATKDVAERLAWLDLQPDDEYRPQPYEQLAAVYARNGFGSQARKVLIAKNRRLARFYRRDMAAGLKRLFRSSGEAVLPGYGFLPGIWHHVLGAVVGYGYRPQRLLYLALGMVALGWLLFGLGGQGAMVPALDGAQGHPPFHALIYSLDTFLPLVDLEQKNRWVPDGRVWWLGWYQVLHILMGWFLTTMGVAALIDRLKR
ncbi:hypothetical protein GKC30_06690 [Pseudodesulfovibrio sp. F-1]|uniref:Membrane-associated oxidoreductase n=1 Tax=Pseudodesulfovibrio alkaliphilus TaxID=2661613 RepID=A0A7K1KMJ5_9BACT|nr:hypothetical protein [Pseudodesulfovibrio alkaliphilus]MUM77314.1 hypothetical protein [Pseudodesulfovibrio alkaliphilus]